jgi:hypothetical protein
MDAFLIFMHAVCAAHLIPLSITDEMLVEVIEFL